MAYSKNHRTETQYKGKAVRSLRENVMSNAEGKIPLIGNTQTGKPTGQQAAGCQELEKD